MMKGKLVKEYEDFYLISDKEIEKGDEYVKLNNRPRTLLLGTTISHVTKVSKLSIQNCNEIFGIIDVEKLAEENYPSGDDWSNEQSLFRKLAFINGFNKAIELNKDKVFTLGQLKTAMDMARVIIDDKYAHSGEEIFQFLQQPKEIDVEIVMDRIPADLAPGGWDVFPKLDSQGCLILKKVL